MKKTIALITAVCMAAMFAGCTSSGNGASSEDNTVTTTDITESADESEPEPVKETAPDPTPLVQQPAPPLPDFTNVAKQYADGKTEIDSKLADIAGKKDHPCINITTEDEKPILSKDEYTAGVIDVFNCDESFALTANGGVKVRGNSTAEQGDEKPYRIKFAEKQNMLGLHGGREYKSWVLLRSYWNLAPDYTAFSLAKVIFEDKYYCTDFMYVNLFINGKPRGIYLLCEQNQAAKDRIEVYEPSEDETQTEIGYLIEMDNYASDEHPYFTIDHIGLNFTDIDGETRTLLEHDYSVKSKINTRGQLDFIKKYTDGCFRILYEAAENDKPMMFDEQYKVVSADGVYATPQEAVEAVIDTESLANMLILEELVHNNDVGAGSFYMARDFSPESRYERLTFTAPWDFNWSYEGDSYGRYYACTFQDIWKDGFDRSNLWYTVAMKAPWFADLVKTKWKSLHESGVLTETTKQVAADCETLRNDLGDNDAWKIDMARNICDFVNGRIKWLDKQWLN